MPIRDFVCSHCKKEQERLCKTDQHEIECKFCNYQAVSKVSAPSGIHFKGTGFYQTDYKDKGK